MRKLMALFLLGAWSAGAAPSTESSAATEVYLCTYAAAAKDAADRTVDTRAYTDAWSNMLEILSGLPTGILLLVR